MKVHFPFTVWGFQEVVHFRTPSLLNDLDGGAIRGRVVGCEPRPWEVGVWGRACYWNRSVTVPLVSLLCVERDCGIRTFGELFVSQSDHRIDTHCTPRGNITRCHGHCRK